MHLILQLAEGRRRAVDAARAEALGVLHAFEPSLPPGGPLGEVGGLFWVDLAAPGPALELRLPLLGYTCAAYELAPLASPPVPERRPRRASGGLPSCVRWRGGWYAVRPLWQRDEAEEREAGPDRRPFLLPGPDGQVREVRGYRGGQRGLPPADARLTVNLSLTPGCARLLDPFAGARGIVAAARLHGLELLSADIDPFLRHGLAALGALHTVADARRLPLLDHSVDAVATEPPYASELLEAVAASLPELARVLRPGGRLCFFAAVLQSPALLAAAPPSLSLLHRFRIDRKGTPCEALVWTRR